MAGPARDDDGQDGPPRGTVGVYDRPAGADRRPLAVRIAIAAIAAAAAMLGWWMFD